MLDNVQESVKRFGPPASRNRSINRRRSGVNYSHGTDGEKNQASYPRNFPAVEHGEVGSNNVAKENTHQKLIPLEGCSTSEAVKFLTDLSKELLTELVISNSRGSDLLEKRNIVDQFEVKYISWRHAYSRWAAAVHHLDDSSADVSVKPVMYSGASGSSWVHFKLPHQMDFLGELQCKIHKANSNLGSNTTDDG